MIRRIFAFALVAVSQMAAAQDPALITFAIPGPAQSPPGEFMQTWVAGFNLTALRAGAHFITLNLPNASSQLVTIDHFEPRAGYRLEDVDGDGVAEFVPDPDATPDQIAWYWYGKSADWTVSLTFERGALAGRIAGTGMSYSVDPRANGITELGWVNSSYWKTHDGDTVEGSATSLPVQSSLPSTKLALGNNSKSTENEVCTIDVDAWDGSCPGSLSTTGHVIDVLVIYLQGTLDAYGSVTGVKAVMHSAIDSANTRAC